MRISKKEQERLEKEEQIKQFNVAKNTVECSNFMMQRLGLEADNFGVLRRIDDEEGEVSELIFEGKKCKSIKSAINKSVEMVFDPYNNAKFACALLNYYISDYIGSEVNTIILTNQSINESGSCEVQFTNGYTVVSNKYNKDSLKYLDVILQLDRALPPDYAILKGFDI